MYRALLGTVGNGTGQATAVSTRTGTAHSTYWRVDHKELVEVIESPGHDTGRSVGKVECVAKLVE